jgi:glucosamine--fructose-6-phosphate aminotransferase (isomerizing)
MKVMEPLEPEVMVRQVERLAQDLRELTRPFDEQVQRILALTDCTSIRKIYLIGAGDSFHASCAAEMAYESFADIDCISMSAFRFLEYGSRRLRDEPIGQNLMIGVSASGGTPRVLEAVQRAKEYGCLTIGITGKTGSKLTQVVDQTVTVELPDNERSPGIRTFQASLIGLFLIAIQLGQARKELPDEQADLIRTELVGLANVIGATITSIAAPCAEVAKMIADSTSLLVVGSGPSYGTALFGAAKLNEAVGILAVGQDLEEWWHVERFAYPTDMPVFVIAPPGRSHARASEFAMTANRLGRRVIAVVHQDDPEIGGHARAVLPVQGEVREEFSPLLYHLFAGYVASHAAKNLGRLLFQSGMQIAGVTQNN